MASVESTTTPPNPLKVRVMMEEMEAVDELVNSAEELKPSHLISAVCMFFSITIRFSIIWRGTVEEGNFERVSHFEQK